MNRDNIFKLANGFRGRAKNCTRIASERMERGNYSISSYAATMRRTTRIIGSRLQHPLNPTSQALSSFSTYSGPAGGGGDDGRGRGRGGPTPRFSFVPPSPPGHPPVPEEEIPRFSLDPSTSEPLGPLGHGRGRGRSMPLDPLNPPSFNSFACAIGAGRGGRVGGEGRFPFHPGQVRRDSPMLEPNRHVRVNGRGSDRGGAFPFHPSGEQQGRSSPPIGGRGGPGSQYQMQQDPEPNKHDRVGRGGDGGNDIGQSFGPPMPSAWRGGSWIRSQMRHEEPNVGSRGGSNWGQDEARAEVVQHEEVGGEGPGNRNRLQRPQASARQWKSTQAHQAPSEGERARGGSWEGRGMNGRGTEGGRGMNRIGMEGGRGIGEGRGRGRGRGMEGGRGRGRGRGRHGSEEESLRNVDLSVGSDADGELFRNRVGFDVMMQLEEGFEEVVSRTMPSPVDEAYLNAIDLNYRVKSL